MSLVPRMKNLLQDAPPIVGGLLARTPFAWRPGFGRLYRKRKREIAGYDELSGDQRRRFILRRMQTIVSYAFENVPFYRRLYQAQNFHPGRLKSFADIARVPIVTKGQMQGTPLEERSAQARGRYVENTGGSSGSPLAFYVLPGSIAHEWAHMHTIWAKLGYRQSDLKLAFGGRNLRDRPLAYDALRHHYAVNIYHPWRSVAEALKQVLRKRPVRYLHGYPSAVYDFATYCATEDLELRRELAGQLRGAFLSSELPTPRYRDGIESVFGVDSVSWYGHTERAVLAWERHAKGMYELFQTYGYGEAVKNSSTGATTLVATAYYNTASPFVRYDTGDEIRVEAAEGGMLERFSIRKGRAGEYVIDASGKRIPLTGLIFGRHHKVFDDARFVQIAQSRPGKAEVYVTPRGTLLPEELPSLFDSSGVDIDFEFRIVSDPIRSVSGKVLLKVPEQQGTRTP